MDADDAIDELLRLARDAALTGNALRVAVASVLAPACPGDHDAAVLRARELLAEHGGALH